MCSLVREVDLPNLSPSERLGWELPSPWVAVTRKRRKKNGRKTYKKLGNGWNFHSIFNIKAQTYNIYCINILIAIIYTRMLRDISLSPCVFCTVLLLHKNKRIKYLCIAKLLKSSYRAARSPPYSASLACPPQALPSTGLSSAPGQSTREKALILICKHLSEEI